MAKINVAINQSDITISRSVARNVIKDIIEYTGFPSDAEIILDDKQGGPRTLSGFSNPCENVLRTENRNYVFATLTERFTEEGVVYDRRPNDRHKRTFANDDLGISIWPLYSDVELELAMRFRTADLSTMTNWTRALRLMDGLRSMVRYHNIKYDYALPTSFLDFIVDAHEMSEDAAPRNKTLKEFVNEGFNEGLILRSNISGTHKQPVINEVQTGLTGLTTTEQSYNGIEIESGIYELQLAYRITYKQIVGSQLVTPILIHNKIIKDCYIDAWFKPLHKHEPFGFVPEGWIPEKIATGEFTRFYKGDGGSRVIPFDDYFPETARKGTATIFLSPIKLSDVDLHTACKLDEIPDELVPAPIKEFIKAEHGVNGNYKESIIVIEVYENYTDELKLQTSISPDGVISTDAPMHMNRRNYVKIDVHKDLSMFNTQTIKRWMKSPEVLFGVCKYIDPSLTFEYNNKSGWVKQVDGSISEPSFYEWLKTLKDVSAKYKALEPSVNPNIGIQTLIGRR